MTSTEPLQLPSSGDPRRQPETGAVLTITGPARPEAVDQVFAALSGPDGADPLGELTEIALAVMHGRLTLVVVVRPGASDRAEESLLTRLTARLSAVTGMDLEVEAAEAPSRDTPEQGPRHVTILGSPIPAPAVSAAIRGIEDAGGCVETVSAASGTPLTGVELVVCGGAPAILCSRLAEVAAATGIDIALS